MDRLPEFPLFEYSDKTDAGPKWEKWIERLELLFTGIVINDNGRNERYYYITQEKVYTTFTMPKRENRQLHTLEPNRYCPPTFLLVRTYKWLCTNLETVNSRELKLLTSTLLNYASYPKTVNFTPRIKKYYLQLFSTESRTDYGEEHYASLT